MQQPNAAYASSIALISVDDSSCLLVFTYGFFTDAVNFLLPSHHSARRALEAAFGIVICPWLELGSAFELHRVRTILCTISTCE
jgi:hypothetical protein